VSRIDVVVATTKSGLVPLADGFARKVAGRDDMTLIEGRCITVEAADVLLRSIPTSPHCAVVLVGPPDEADSVARRWLAERSDIVVMLLDNSSDKIVRVAVHNPGLSEILDALRDFVERVHAGGRPRVTRLRLDGGAAQTPPGEGPPFQPPTAVPPGGGGGGDEPPPDPGRDRSLLVAAIAWVHQLLRNAIERVPDANGDVHGLSVTKKTLLDTFKESREGAVVPRGVQDAEATLLRELKDADPLTEPLARAAYVFKLDWLEFRMLVLSLAPELDIRFQRALGFLLDEMPRRVGTFAFYSQLLGATPTVRQDLSEGGSLAQWAIFENGDGDAYASDQPLRLDPFLAQWLLGVSDALRLDPRVRRVLREAPWAGARLLKRPEDEKAATDLIDQLLIDPQERPADDEPEQDSDAPCPPEDPGSPELPQWLLLDGIDPASWRAFVELGAERSKTPVAPIRIEPARLAGADILEVEATARRIGRLATCQDRPLLIDVTGVGATPEDDEWLRRFFFTLGATARRVGVIATGDARFIRLLGAMSFARFGDSPLSTDAKIAAMHVAANEAGVYLGEDGASSLIGRYPLSIDSLDLAARLAHSRPIDTSVEQPALARFVAALKEVASEGLSNLAERLDAVFTLDSVVLPKDRHQQLIEIVDNVRYASRVLDDWKFGAQLPYGRGIAALFHGPSGTGKTMAAIAIAHKLGVQLLRLDLSRVVSKYIGDTEKNIDVVFTEAERTGSAILIDEAESLLAKRSEVKDAHDRYANIEVAYLLTRIERFRSRTHGGGLLFFTTNLRQSLDSAFLRRLRFIIEFPRPTAEAREQIWRQCLPRGSHSLDDAAFKQLARRIDLTGGHIRQITLRAAFIAAAAGSLIELKHIAPAATAELAKLGMPAVELDLNASRQAA
jgi:SpoVK/Ycf46/Vps4 family AAA+-type ATPase